MAAQIRRNAGRAASQARGGNGRYIYALVADPVAKGFDFTGIDGRPVHAMMVDGIACVASEIEAAKIRPERRHLAIHHTVLGKLLEQHEAVLPMRFGLIASTPGEITRLLSRNRDAIVRQLNLIAGKIEMGLKVVWDVPNIFEYFVNTHAELREMRDAVFLGCGAVPQHRRIELGRLFEHLLEEERVAHTQTVEEAMSLRCVEIKRNRLHEEREVMNLACLVERHRRDEFEQGVFDTARDFDNSFAFDYNGPWAPHAFAKINLRI